MRNLDFSSWQALLSTLLGLAVITLIGVGIRLLAMQVIQQRRERENRQINERLRTLIAAYKTLGGSFTGNLAVDPTHLRDLRRRSELAAGSALADVVDTAQNEWPSAERSRRVRDAVEAALSDIILLGTEEQVQLAATAATELAAGRPTHTAELVVSLRDFIRQVLGLDPVPTNLSIPKQGPARLPVSRGKGDGGGKDDSKGGGGKGMGGAAGAGMGAGVGMGLGGSVAHDDEHDHH
jgi:heme exporter protein D